MREASRDEQLQVIFAAKLYARPLQVGRGCRPEINGDVQDFSTNDANKLCLGIFPCLKMQAPDNAVAGIRLIILNKRNRLSAEPLENLLVKAFEKITPVVLEDRRTENNAVF